MKCPYCNGKSAVIDTVSDCDVVIRKRRCRDCNSRFYTQELDISLNEGKKLMSDIRSKLKETPCSIIEVRD